jgi:hypothetical protein
LPSNGVRKRYSWGNKTIWLHLGNVFRERGKLSQAEDAFIRSRDGCLALERSGLAIEAIAGLAARRGHAGMIMGGSGH